MKYLVLLLFPLMCQAALVPAKESSKKTRAVLAARAAEKMAQADAALPPAIDTIVGQAVDAGLCETSVSIDDVSDGVLNAQVRRLQGLGYTVRTYSEELSNDETAGFIDIKWCE